MTEEKVKRRDWVKNAAIIFLAVLLILTFFSNTIMNRSLPEVAVSYVESGVIQAQVRGSGTITPIESFDVKSTQTRTVLSVPVQVGDEVRVGDVLLYYADAKSEDIKAAEDALDNAMLSYQQALINSTTGQYSELKRAVESARADLEAAKAERDSLSSGAGTVSAAKAALEAADARLAQAAAAFASAQSAYDNYIPLDPAAAGALTEYKQALKGMESARLVSGAVYEAFRAAALSAYPGSAETAAMAALAAVYSAYGNDASHQNEYRQYLAYSEMTAASERLKSSETALDQALTAAGDNQYETLNKALGDAKNAQALAKAERDQAALALEALLSGGNSDYAAAEEKVKQCEKLLQDALFNYEKNAALDNLHLDAQRKDIEELQAELNSLRGDGEQNVSVTSQVNGIVSAVNISAGNMAEAGATLLSVEVPDLGYSLSFSVSNAQSQRVRVGDTAQVEYYWGDEINATLAAIRTDPANPTTNKLLVFKLTGEGVRSGLQLNLSIGEKGVSYETLVPNSAVRTDSNGSFVLVVMAKETGLGSRYTAQRIDVQVAAKDDVNSGVTGALSYGDYVITSASAPIESGTLVRLPD